MRGKRSKSGKRTREEEHAAELAEKDEVIKDLQQQIRKLASVVGILEYRSQTTLDIINLIAAEDPKFAPAIDYGRYKVKKDMAHWKKQKEQE